MVPPEPGTVVPSAIAEGLHGAGHDVEVLTGFPNYPTGRVLDGYRVRPYQRETTPSGIPVHRAPLWPNHDAPRRRRMANYLSFAAGASAVASHPRPPAGRLAGVLLARHGGAARSYGSPSAPPPVLPARPGPLARQRHRQRLRRRPAGAAVEAALTRFCDATYRHAGGIGVISPGMRRVLVDRGVPDHLIHDTPNWISDDHLLPDAAPGAALRAELGLPSGRTWMYAGNLGELQGLDGLVNAFARRPEAQLVLVATGSHVGGWSALTTRLGATNVRFVGSVATSEVGRWIAASDVQVVSLQDTPLLRVTMPSKVQTSLAAARPVLVHAAGDAASVVTDARCGWAATPGDAAALDAAIGASLDSTESELATMGRRSARPLREALLPASRATAPRASPRVRGGWPAALTPNPSACGHEGRSQRSGVVVAPALVVQLHPLLGSPAGGR